MVPSLESPGRPLSLRMWMLRGLVLALILCTAFAAAGCGGKAKSTAATTEEESAPSPPSKSEAKAAEKKPAKTPAKSASKSAAKTTADKPAEKSSKADKPTPKTVKEASGNSTITLVDRGCVSFEPHWTTIRVGQSLTFHSQLKKTVTVHVPPGVFDRDEYEVGPNKYVHTGPAQEPGDHTLWSLPSACQAAPHGVQGAGPGVTVEE